MDALTGPRGYWRCDRDCDCRDYFKRLLALPSAPWSDKELMFCLTYMCGCRLKGNREWAQETRERYYRLKAIIAERRQANG